MDILVISEQRLKEILAEQFSKLSGTVKTNGTEKKYLTVKDLSAYIHLSVPSIYKKVADDTIPHHNMGSRIVFEQNEIDMWLSKQ